MKKALAFFLALICLMSVCPVFAEGALYPIRFGTVEWLSAPEALAQYLANDEHSWSELTESIRHGKLFYGTVVVAVGEQLKFYGSGNISGQWDKVLYEGLVEPKETVLCAGQKIGQIHPVYVQDGKEKKLISVTVGLRALSREFDNARAELVKTYGEPMIDQDWLSLWSDPDSETDDTMLALVKTGNSLDVVYCIADVEALLNSAK